MIVLDFVCKKCFGFLKPKLSCYFLAHHQLYTMFAFHYLIIEEHCFPPNLYNVLFYLTLVVAGVSVVTGIILWIGLYSKNKPKMLTAYLLVQHISILYAWVVGLLLYGTNYGDTEECNSDELIGGASFLLVIWNCYVYICVNSHRVQKLAETNKQKEESGDIPEEGGNVLIK